MNILANSTIICPFGKTPFQAVNGTGPYAYSVQPGGAGGTISSTGVYTAPGSIKEDPRQNIDTIIASDYLGQEATIQVSVLSPMAVMGEVIRRYMDLEVGQVYLYNQKYKIPEDSKLYIAIGVLNSMPFANNTRYASTSGMDEIQSINVRDLVTINIMSRSTDALNRKEEVLMAFNSLFSRNAQDLNSISFAPLATQFVNLVRQEGSAMLYQFSITASLQYFKKKVKPVAYYSEFSSPVVTTDE